MITDSFTFAICFGVLSAVSLYTSASITGTVRLYRNGVPDTNQSWSSGIVQIYYSNTWGNICDDSSFGSDEADVICHQLGYTGASSYSNAGNKTWGLDQSNTVLHQVSCNSSSYLAITQCHFNNTVHPLMCNDSMDVAVMCNSARIWDSPFTGAIRLTGGEYSSTGGDYTNEGLLEVYCENKWGVVCSRHFRNDTEARISCRQLGYNSYTFKEVSNQNNREIFLSYQSTSLCSAEDSNCLIECGPCELSSLTTCTQDQVVYLECGYSADLSRVNTLESDTCHISAVAIAIIIGATIGSIVACILCVCLTIGVPVCICACLGVGIGAALSGKGGKRQSIPIRKPSSTKDTPLVSKKGTDVEQPPATAETTAADSASGGGGAPSSTGDKPGAGEEGKESEKQKEDSADSNKQSTDDTEKGDATA